MEGRVLVSGLWPPGSWPGDKGVVVEEAPGGAAASSFIKQNSSSKRAGRSLQAGNPAPTRVCPPSFCWQDLLGGWAQAHEWAEGQGARGGLRGLSNTQGPPPAAALSREAVFSRPGQSSCCSVTQSCPTLCDPMNRSTPPCPSPTPRVYPNSCPSSQ